VISISSNLNEVTTRLVAKLQSVNDPNGAARDLMLRQVASDTAAQVTYRIHTEGLNSNAKPIGEYSNAYLRVRRKNNRGDSKKVILSLTGQMENDFGIVANQANRYGLGFKNELNAQKAEWLQERDDYGRIYDLTEAELAHANLVANDFIAQYLNESTR
jgi:hypothetical protein